MHAHLKYQKGIVIVLIVITVMLDFVVLPSASHTHTSPATLYLLFVGLIALE